jgi:hypothetical protein
VPAALYTVKLTCGIDMTTAFEPSELAKGETLCAAHEKIEKFVDITEVAPALTPEEKVEYDKLMATDGLSAAEANRFRQLDLKHNNHLIYQRSLNVGEGGAA